MTKCVILFFTAEAIALMKNQLLLILTCLIAFTSQAFAADRYLYIAAAEGDSMKVYNINMERFYDGILKTKKDTLSCEYKDAAGNRQTFDMSYSPCDDAVEMSIYMNAKGGQSSTDQNFVDHRSLFINASLTLAGTDNYLAVVSATQYQRILKLTGPNRADSFPSMANTIPVTVVRGGADFEHQAPSSLSCGIVQIQYDCSNDR